MSLNLFIFCGRLVRDPEIKYSANQKAVATFTAAVDRDYKRVGLPEADFLNCICYGKPAESAEKYLAKGVKIIGTGSVQNNNYEKDGVKHYGTQIVLSRWEFAESKKAMSEAAEMESESGQQQTDAKDDGFMSIPKNLEIDMPFA